MSASSVDFPTAEADWLGVREAVDRIVGAAVPLDPVRLPLERATGTVLAETVVARVDLPPWDNAAMDGYAVRSEDLDGFGADGLVLPVDGEVRAGAPPRKAPPAGHAVRIMTGAPIPEGMDSVIRVEDTDREAGAPGRIHIRTDRDRGRHVRPAGQDMRRGADLLAPGDRLTAGRVGLLAAAGRDPVRVHPTPRVTLLPTGDELRRPEDFSDVADGLAIPESNGPTLAALCREIGVAPTLLPPVPDDDTALGDAVDGALTGSDVLVTLGGASMGTADRVKPVLDTRGFRREFWRVLMRPGSPFSFGWLPREGAPDLAVFGLPGNPASAFVTFQVLVRPFLRRLAGRSDLHLPVLRASAAEPFPTHDRRTQFVRVRLAEDREGRLTARSTGPQGSGLVHGLALAQGLAVVPAGLAECPVGTPLDVLRLSLDDGVAQPGYQDRAEGT
ncbi:MAG TPA: gephyrin-like molybdotransferase Glp [Longimicrobiales bacterium]|nr:gephyrin-like molybdotransferase Glp [Longimicrobiales bacterium]